MQTRQLLAIGAVLSFAMACSDKDGDSTVVNNNVTTDVVAADLRMNASMANASALTAPSPDTPEIVELGRLLFFDKILSGNRNISCATCHHPLSSTADNLPVSLGQGGHGLAETRTGTNHELIPRNAPDIFNRGVAGFNSMFWDSRLSHDPATNTLDTPEPGLNGTNPALAAIKAQLNNALDAQAMFPVTSREEMRGQTSDFPGNELAEAGISNQVIWERLMARLIGTQANNFTDGIAQYRTLFQAAYPGTALADFNFGHAARAMGAFERQIWPATNTRYDQFMAGDDSALTGTEKRGMELFFGRAKCSECHSGPHLTDFEHHAIGVPQIGPGKGGEMDDRGRALETGVTLDNYKFRTPALRNVAITGPYMHDGTFKTLEAVVRHHLNPAAGLSNYNPQAELRPIFANTAANFTAQNAQRLAAIDPILQSPIFLSDSEVNDIVAFLNALTDPKSLNLRESTPVTVPSGLPVVE